MKKLTQSRTIKVGSFYIGLGVLLGALQIFDQLEIVIAPMMTTDSAIGWGSVILAIMGGVQIWLRLITSQPIGNEPN
ncbi:hypothetical protein LCGC14_0983790 [marine sediment metagenome]|uniref:Uncharacterized protein n=1 Tax=marine sediment metagenome TaxID=412755 RepID=A0A0F9REE7_9ZZZZ